MDFSHKMQISCLKLEPSQNEKRGREILHRLACIQISFIFQCNSLGLAARRRTFHTKMKTLWRSFYCKYQIMDSDVFNDRLHRYWRLLRRRRRQLANLARCTIFFRLFRKKLRNKTMKLSQKLFTVQQATFNIHESCVCTVYLSINYGFAEPSRLARLFDDWSTDLMIQCMWKRPLFTQGNDHFTTFHCDDGAARPC